MDYKSILDIQEKIERSSLNSIIKTKQEANYYDYFSPVSDSFKPYLYTTETVNIILPYIIKRKTNITNINHSSLGKFNPDFIFEEICELPVKQYDSLMPSMQNLLFVKNDSQQPLPKENYKILKTVFAFDVPMRFRANHYFIPPIYNAELIDLYDTGEYYGIPSTCTVSINCDNRYATSVWEKSGKNRICEGIYELNLNLAHELDRVKEPGLAMVVDFFRYANVPVKFQQIVDNITDADIKADAQKLADIMKNHMVSYSVAKLLKNKDDEADGYVAFDWDDTEKMVSATDVVFKGERKHHRETEEMKKNALKVVLRDFAKDPDGDFELLLGVTADVLLKAQGKPIEEAYDVFLASLFKTAKSMINEGKSIDEIFERTGLSDTAIDRIKFNMEEEIEGEFFEFIKDWAW
ncbi:MAG: hypothetical protein LBT59_16620 [Clostridiales bacterium]|nr:hypothetical protein [Clostridiales bacterium]